MLGATAALLLAREGKKVALIEARRIGSGETGRTTAHLTELLDTRYHVLESKFGREGAALVAASSRAAMDRMEGFVDELGLDCGFARVPAYLVARDEQQRVELSRELESLERVVGRASVARQEDGLIRRFVTAAKLAQAERKRGARGRGR